MLRPRLACLYFSVLFPILSAPPDLIVVGGGIAGLSAALEGARAGLAVTVVERNSVSGGHAVISSGGLSIVGSPVQQRMKIDDTPELAMRDFLAWGEDANEEFVRFYVTRSKTEIYDWMTALGTEFPSAFLNGAGNSVARFHVPTGQGVGLIVPLQRAILKQGGVTFLQNSKVTGLLVTGGKVTGVRMENLRTGRKSELTGGAVLLSTGGYAANLDIVRANWPPHMPVPDRVLVGGGFFATGVGMDLAREAGGTSGKLDHQWNYGNGLPDPFDPEGKRGFFANSFTSIWVNAQGKRFVLEQHEPKITVPEIAKQNPARFWAIFDSAGRRGFRVVHSGFTQDRVEEIFEKSDLIKRGETIEQLASNAGLPPDVLKATVERYNAMVEAGEDTEFQRFGPKAPRSRGFFIPPTRILQPPFYAAPMYILIRKSGGGIRVDSQCRVLNERGEPVPGLLAAGEATGFAGINGKHGMEGTFLGPSILMGRVAAQTVAATADRKPAAAALTEIRTAPKAAPLKYAATCTGCHDLPKLTSARRNGYWHFEEAHKLVLARKWNCLGCHGEMAPFRTASHKIDRQVQTSVCQHCHISPAFGRRAAAE